MFDLNQDSDSMKVSNISSKVTGPIVIKFHVESLWAEERKVYSNSSGLTTNMAVIPVHGKKPLKLFSSGTSRPVALNFDMYWSITKIVQIMTFG